ncbi:FKBP-type peptidyl-prolyl cis-trans isomerase [Pseudonocardia nigra]|uniref:FKBP-type peptidyl-prolyl cis-trans isomerase n=1 Tax=Pseudonocardia nigra TaxID=1921578 RepID=UPI001C6079B7|nr:FKBP-type peptidyl-prolyl cis-trans isomerase [Pseudonocardia nigra]
MKRSLLVAAAAVLVSVAGCGGGEPAPAAQQQAPAAAPTPAGSAAGVPPLTGDPTDLAAPSQAQAGTGEPPTELVTQDVVVGTGPAATLDDTVEVHYSGTLYQDGTLFDSSWESGAPVEFPLDGVVPGFAQGIEGMQVGGRRVIVIPPELGYGDRDQGPIPGGSTLVFVVDLVGIS